MLKTIIAHPKIKFRKLLRENSKDNYALRFKQLVDFVIR